MTSPDIRWIALVHSADRTGSLTAVTSVFANRGVSFDSLNAAPRDAAGVITIEFTASERLARVICRTLERLAVVSSVQREAVPAPE